MDNLLKNDTQDVMAVREVDRYLLQIHRIKLQNYLKLGLIAPDKYLGDECEKDMQSKNRDFLIVSDGYIGELNEKQILIELILTEEEQSKLSIAGDVSYFDFPLPITRIKKVYVYDKSTQKHISVNIKTSENGFLPDRLFDVYRKNKKIIFDKRWLNTLNENAVSGDYYGKIREFDKRMGMFAFIKNTNIYYSNDTNAISNYSDNYFTLLSKVIYEKLNDKKFDGLEILSRYEKFKTLLYSDKQLGEDFIKEFCEDIENGETREIFTNLLKPNSIRKTLPLLLEKDKNLFYIALIYYFKQKSSNKILNEKTNIKDIIPKEVAEVSLALLGIYLGYSELRGSEKIDIEDSFFKNIFGNEFNIKFMLDSELDYITIEAIYNYSFYGHKESERPDYLSYPTQKQSTVKFPSDSNFKAWYETKQESIFDVQYIRIRKKSFKELAEQMLEKYGEKIVFGKDYLSNFVAKHYVSCFEIKNGIYCLKENVLSKITAETDRKIQNEFLKVCKLDKK